MNVFRTQEHVPDVYPRKSRDFQLMCNIFDCVQGAVKYDIDSIRDVVDTDLCNQRVLNYLQTKLGFFTDVKMTSDTQRTILKAFPYLIKNKGSRKGIEQSIQVFLKTQNVSGEIKVLITNKRVNNKIVQSEPSEVYMDVLENVYVVQVSMSTKELDITILDEILKYIIPAGYKIEYVFYTPFYPEEFITNSDTIKIVFVEDALHSGIRLSKEDFELLPINSISTTRVVPEETSLYPQGKDTVKINKAENIRDVSINNETQYTAKEVP